MASSHSEVKHRGMYLKSLMQAKEVYSFLLKDTSNHSVEIDSVKEEAASWRYGVTWLTYTPHQHKTISGSTKFFMTKDSALAKMSYYKRDTLVYLIHIDSVR